MIDSHVHVWTDETRKYPRVLSGPHFEPPRFTPEDFFRHAGPSGVSRAVLIQMSFYRYDNSYMLDSLRAHQGRFSGVAIVDSSAAEPDLAMKKLAMKGVRGFRIHPGDSRRNWLDTSGMQARNAWIKTNHSAQFCSQS